MDSRQRVRGIPENATEGARQLRRRETLAERQLWQELRNRGLNGLKFRRQQPLGPYVVDFCCAEHRLIIELDGEVHAGQQEYDSARTAHLEAYGYSVLRFRNDEVLNNISGVLEKIASSISSVSLLPGLGEGLGMRANRGQAGRN